MSNPTALTTLPDGSPNNTGLQIDSETVQINVNVEDHGRGRKSDIYIIPASNARRPVRQIPTQWDPPSTETTKRVVGTVWKNGQEQHGFDLSGETYDGLHEGGAWDDYLEHHANGDIEEADALADEHKPTPSSGL